MNPTETSCRQVLKPSVLPHQVDKAPHMQDSTDYTALLFTSWFTAGRWRLMLPTASEEMLADPSYDLLTGDFPNKPLPLCISDWKTTSKISSEGNQGEPITHRSQFYSLPHSKMHFQNILCVVSYSLCNENSNLFVRFMLQHKYIIQEFVHCLEI